MRRTHLDAVLRSVPYIASLGIAVVKSSADEVVLRLPDTHFVSGQKGNVHSSALFVLGELAATLLLKGHPGLAPYEVLLKGTTIDYRRTPKGSATATAKFDELALSNATTPMSGDKTSHKQSVAITDEQGQVLAAVETSFTVRLKAKH